MASIKNKLKIAVVGATGTVGRAVLSILAEHGYRADQVKAVASHRSEGSQVSFGEDAVLAVVPLHTFDFSSVDVILSSAGGKISAEFVPLAVDAGAVVIDNTSHFRMHKDVPLVVPQVNGEVLSSFHSGIIANPNCSTIQLVMALKPLHTVAPIRRVVCSTYQSVSGAGKEAMDELFSQTRGSFTNAPVFPKCFPKPIAFNVIPHIDVFQSDGETKEEWKMAVETQKIMGADIALTATCVRVPVFIGHAVAATVEFQAPISVADARRALKHFPGVQVVDNPAEIGYTTPIESVGEDTVFVSRIRADKTVAHGLNLWIVADNIRKGAALNAVQILNTLQKCDKFIAMVTKKPS